MDSGKVGKVSDSPTVRQQHLRQPEPLEISPSPEQKQAAKKRDKRPIGRYAPGVRTLGGIVMPHVKTVAEWMAERALGLPEVVASSGLEKRIAEAIVLGHYTASPAQRQQIANSLGVNPDEIACGHQVQVEHLYGHGAQFGRSP